MGERRFTREELRQYNGKDGAPAYIAYKGNVYDFSESFLWQNGEHQVLHTAGEDLTGDLEQAPHGADLLKQFPIVGTLKELKKIARRHSDTEYVKLMQQKKA